MNQNSVYGFNNFKQLLVVKQEIIINVLVIIQQWVRAGNRSSASDKLGAIFYFNIYEKKENSQMTILTLQNFKAFD